MALTLDDLQQDMEELGIEELENGYIYEGEYYESEEDLVAALVEEDHFEISAAGGFVDLEDLDLNFPASAYEDDNDEFDDDYL